MWKTAFNIFEVIWSASADHVTTNFLTAVFHNFYLGHSWILCHIYKDKHSSYKELLEKDSSVSVYERNVQMLTTKLYKVSNSFSSPHINEIFKIRNKQRYNLSQKSQVSRPSKITISQNWKSFLFRAKSLEYTSKQLQKNRWSK